MGYVVRSLTVLCLGTALAGPAYALLSGCYTFGTNSLSLNNDDLTRLIDAANGLLRQSPLPVGATTKWQENRTRLCWDHQRDVALHARRDALP